MENQIKKSKILSRRDIIKTAASMPIAFLPFNANAGERPATYSEIGKTSPNLSLSMLGGGKLTNAKFKGKTTILEFFGLWCPDCMIDAPLVAQFAKKANATKNMQFIAVHTHGRYGRWGSLDKFFKEKGYKYPVAIDDDKTAYNAFKIAWVPSFVIIDKNGIIRDYTNDLGVEGIGVDGLMAKAIAVSKLK